MSKQPKNPLIAASNALGFQARKLREAATVATEPQPSHEPEAPVIAALHTVAMKHARSAAEQKQAARDAAVAKIQPMIDRARRQIADADEARAEARNFVQKFANVQWDALRDR